MWHVNTVAVAASVRRIIDFEFDLCCKFNYCPRCCHTHRNIHSHVKAYLINYLFMLFILDSRQSLLRVIQNNRPACVASRQTTDAFWSRRLPACRIVLRRRSPRPPLSLLPLGHSGWVCLAAGGFVVGWQHSSFFYDLF